MDSFTTFNTLITSLPIMVTIFYTFYLLKIGRNQPTLGNVSKRTVLLMWFWFLSVFAIAYFRVFSHEVSFENGDLLTFSIYIALLSFGPIIALVLAKKSVAFHKLLSVIPTYVLVASQIIRLGGYSYWEAYKDGEIPFNLGLSIAGLDVFLALCTPFLAYALFKKFGWAARATLAWAFLGIFDVLNAAVQMCMGFFGVGGMSSASINLPLSNLIELYQVGIGVIIHIIVIKRFINNKL